MLHVKDRSTSGTSVTLSLSIERALEYARAYARRCNHELETRQAGYTARAGRRVTFWYTDGEATLPIW